MSKNILQMQWLLFLGVHRQRGIEHQIDAISIARTITMAGLHVHT